MEGLTRAVLQSVVPVPLSSPSRAEPVVHTLSGLWLSPPNSQALQLWSLPQLAVSPNLILITDTYCPAITPPLFATYFQEKEGGGVTTRTCGFTSQLSPPPPHPSNSRTEINEALLCGRRRELLRSTCCGSTEGWKSCWPRTCCRFLQSSLTARLLPPAARLHGRMMCRITGLRKPSKISDKGQDQFSNYFLHARYTNTTLLHLQHAYTCKNCSTANRFERSAGGGGGM